MLPVVFYHGIEGSVLHEAGALGQPQHEDGEADECGVLAGLARLAADAVNALAHAVEAAAGGSLPLLLTSAVHARWLVGPGVAGWDAGERCLGAAAAIQAGQQRRGLLTAPEQTVQLCQPT